MAWLRDGAAYPAAIERSPANVARSIFSLFFAKAAHMSTGHQEQPSLREHVDAARTFLSAVAEKLTARGIKARVSCDCGIPTLTAADTRSGRVTADVTMDSDSWIEAAWAPAPGADPATTASTILAVLDAISPGPSSADAGSRLQ
jgi:5,10-methylene-tetrahydrofolate dehydrogenase/methenyl tetrahydrofolate cyclohydrolase